MGNLNPCASAREDNAYHTIRLAQADGLVTEDITPRELTPSHVGLHVDCLLQAPHGPDHDTAFVLTQVNRWLADEEAVQIHEQFLDDGIAHKMLKSGHLYAVRIVEEDSATQNPSKIAMAYDHLQQTHQLALRILQSTVIHKSKRARAATTIATCEETIVGMAKILRVPTLRPEVAGLMANVSKVLAETTTDKTILKRELPDALRVCKGVTKGAGATKALQEAIVALA